MQVRTGRRCTPESGFPKRGTRTRSFCTVLASLCIATPLAGQIEAGTMSEAMARFNQTVERTAKLGVQDLFDDVANELRIELAQAAAPSIYLGDEVGATQHTDAVAVFADGGWNCSGTLIARDLVITTGHCRNPIRWVLFGASVGTGERIDVVEVDRHPPSPGYDRPVLLRLERTPSYATPVRRATNQDIDKRSFAHIVGFGATSSSGSGSGRKRAAMVQIISYYCNSTVKGVTDSDRYHCEPDREIVAGQPGGADTCKGDSGGPLYIAMPGNVFAIAGITRRGVTPACGSGGVYMRINKYSIWLDGHIP